MRPISYGVSPVAATSTVVYTVPKGYYAVMRLLYLHNTGGATKHITAQWYDSSLNTTLDIVTALSLTTKEYLQLNGDAYIVLEESDQLKVTTESGSSFSVIASFDEIGLTRQ